jgi:hypothetical protein
MLDVGLHTSDTREQRVFWFAANLQPRFVPTQKNQNRDRHPQARRNIAPPRVQKGHDLAPHPSNILNCVGRLPCIHRLIRSRCLGCKVHKLNLRAMEIVYKMQ